MDTEAQLRRAYRAAGHSVVAAHSAQEAFAFLDTQNHADVIICTAYLQDEPMFDFLKQLRITPFNRFNVLDTRFGARDRWALKLTPQP